MSDGCIQLDRVQKSFPGAERPALQELSAVLRPGRITGVVGPDGAGKTTLMRLMAGLMAPSAGTVRVDGSDPFHSTGSSRETIGYMPQKFGLYEDLTVRENLTLHADLRGVIGEERVKSFERLLEFTGLRPFTGRLAGKLSGGMKQKLGLACALLGQPRFLLLDEPGVGVDPISRRELWGMVGDIAQRGLTVVWSTAYLEEAERCAEVLMLNQGKLLFFGRAAELTSGLRGRCFQIRGATGDRRKLLLQVLRHPGVLDATIQGQAVRLVMRPGEVAPAPGEWVGESATLHPAEATFEDAFIDALGGSASGESALASRSHRISGQQDVVVEAQELTRKFGAFTAADRVSFQVRRGEIFGLLGPNGAGKSTTFRMMCGLLTPTMGTAHVMGINLRKSPSAARQRLGYMAQKFSLYGNLSVQQNLKFFSGVYGLRGERQRRVVSEMVEIFRLGDLLGHPTETLPLGFKQRLALACAVMHEPDILFLDEPTSGVDPVTRREFWNHINGLVGKGVTIVVTTHFMEEAEYCDRIALIYRGGIIAEGAPDDLKSAAATRHMPSPTMEDAFVELVGRNEPRESTAGKEEE